MTDIFKEGQRATIIAALTTVFFAVAKAIVGFISGSVVLMADAVHSGADAFSTFAAWFGLKIAQKKPSERFPYGFYKAENITALLISLLILFAGYNIIQESFSKIFTEYQLNIPLIAVGVAILDAIVMFSVGSYELKIGKKINSQSLIADGRESRMHLLSSSMVLVGIFANLFGIRYLEGIMGILISFFIFQVGLESIRDSVFALMDVSPSRKTENEIKNVLRNISGLRGFEGLKLRKSGPFIFGEVRAKIGKNVNVKRAHEISDNIEREIKKKIKTVDSFTISLEPFETKKQKICIPIDKNESLDSRISSHFGRAGNFIFVNLDNGRIQDYYIKENPYRDKEVRAGLEASNFVVKEKIDSIVTIEMGPISLHTLRDDIVDVYEGKEGTVKEVVEGFLKKEFSFLKEATREKV